MVSKKGILRTLEALIALFIVMFFLLTFMPRTPKVEVAGPIGFLSSLRFDDGLRYCVLLSNETCVTQIIDDNLDDSFEFTFNISESPTTEITGLPPVQVFSEALYISGNTTNSSARILRVFYWSK